MLILAVNFIISSPEAAFRRCSLKKAQACNFIKRETLAQVFSNKFRETSKNTFYYRTPLVAVSGSPYQLQHELFSHTSERSVMREFENQYSW